MIQIIAAIFFIVPVVTIIRALRSRAWAEHIPDVIITTVNGALLTVLTSYYLIIWSWSGNNRSLFTHVALSAAVAATSLVATAVLTFILFIFMRITGKRIHATWYLPLIQIAAAYAAIAYFTFAIPFINAQREIQYREKNKQVVETAGDLTGTTAMLRDKNIELTVVLDNTASKDYSVEVTTKISADPYMVSKEDCSDNQVAHIATGDKNVRIIIPFQLLRRCLDKKRISTENAIMNGLILTTHMFLVEGNVSTPLAPVSLNKWIYITVDKSSIQLSDHAGHEKTVQW